MGLSGDTQIRALVRALHVYLDQLALRILRDVMPRISRPDFVQVVVAYFNSVRALFHAIKFLPDAIITIACYCSIARIRYLSLSSFHDCRNIH